MKAWFISDVHLKNLNERNGNILLRFLLSLKNKEQPVTHLFLLGDIFDFWVGDHDFYQKKFGPLVEAIVDLKSQGIEIYYFEGNHDVHVKKFWEERYGIPCFVEEKYFQLGESLVRVEHGDFINPKDTQYLRYREFIRQPYMEQLAHALPAKAFSEIGDWASRWSRKRSSVDRRDHEENLRQMIRTYAERKFAETPFDCIVTGHMHVQDDYTFSVAGRSVRSVNLGSWFSEQKVFVLPEGEWQILT